MHLNIHNSDRVNFRPGQVWRYQTRPHEPHSTLTILLVEDTTVHICIDQIRLRNKHVEGGIQTEFPHTPIQLEALQRSVTEQVDNIEITEMPEGYDIWREQKGGVFSLEVAEVLNAIEEMLA